jgi:hypothetical protein
VSGVVRPDPIGNGEETTMAKEATAAEKQESAATNGSDAAIEQANEAVSGLRAAIGEASRTLRMLARAGEERARGAEARAVEIGKQLRGHGERAAGGVAQQVKENPLASLAVAFALGFLCAALVRR